MLRRSLVVGRAKKRGERGERWREKEGGEGEGKK
jgi:hypothetical protein